MPARERPRRPHGFTLVELITVIVLVAVVGAMAAPRFFERQTFDARSYADQVQAMLRYAQKLAVAQGQPVYVRLDGNSVALCRAYASDPLRPQCSPANQVPPPAGNNSASSATLAACANQTGWYCEGRPNGVTQVANPVTAYFYFDPLGKPFAAADVSPTTVSTFPARLQLTISGGGNVRSLFVESETGYVYQ